MDIDGRVVELCREHFPDINAKAFKDRRLTIEIADAFEYLGRSESRARFDLIVADRPDPVGPGKALFGETFYDRVKGALRPGGFATFQTGVPFYQPGEITDALKELAEFFPQSGLYLTVVPSYIGGFMALSWAGKGKRLGSPQGITRARAAFRRLKLKTDYYNPAVRLRPHSRSPNGSSDSFPNASCSFAGDVFSLRLPQRASEGLIDRNDRSFDTATVLSASVNCVASSEALCIQHNRGRS